MKFRFIEDHRDTWPVRLMCDALEVSAGGQYACRGRRSMEMFRFFRWFLQIDLRAIHSR
jgi:hypothetical protein